MSVNPTIVADRKILIDRGLEQACRRRLLHNIHSGVRVKIRTHPLQKMLKHVWIKFDSSASKRKHIGIQTSPIARIDRQTSYDLFEFSSSSSSSFSETSRSEEIPDETRSTTSSDTASTSTTSIDRIYQRYLTPNRNNHALDSTRLSTNEAEDESPIEIDVGRRRRRIRARFLAPFLHLTSFFRISSWIPNDSGHQGTTAPSTSRCRRSMARSPPSPTSIVPMKISEDPPLEKSLSIAPLLPMSNNSSLPLRPHPHRRKKRRSKKPTIISSIPLSSSSSSHEHPVDVDIDPLPKENPIHLRVKNKDLLPTLSRLAIKAPPTFDHHQMNVVREFQAILEQNKNQHSQASSNESANSSSTHPIIQQGIQQLERYQQYAQGYKLKSNPAVKQFLFKSAALSSEALHRLSMQYSSN